MEEEKFLQAPLGGREAPNEEGTGKGSLFKAGAKKGVKIGRWMWRGQHFKSMKKLVGPSSSYPTTSSPFLSLLVKLNSLSKGGKGKLVGSEESWGNYFCLPRTYVLVYEYWYGTTQTGKASSFLTSQGETETG